ncbi:hypothetical protein LguiB_007509 [Lonicera macranthoides]
MLDPANELLPQPSSPTNSSISSSDLDTESTGSFFHDRSTTLGTLMGVTFPTITFRAPSQRRELSTVSAAAIGNSAGGRRTRKVKRNSKQVAFVAEHRRRRRWWSLCKDDESKPSSLGEFLEVERRFGDGAFFGVEAELEVQDTRPANGRLLFADGRVLPPANDVEEGTSTASGLCRFPVSLTGICCGGVG